MAWVMDRSLQLGPLVFMPHAWAASLGKEALGRERTWEAQGKAHETEPAVRGL